MKITNTPKEQIKKKVFEWIFVAKDENPATAPSKDSDSKKVQKAVKMMSFGKMC